MNRLTQEIEGKIEMLCRFEDCMTDEEICPGCNKDECLCLQAILDKLKQYEDAEEQGLLLRLPCKVGDTVYQPIFNRINEYKIIGLAYDIYRKEWSYEVAYQIGLEWHKTICRIDDIGKTVFLTKEEAEQKLKEMESGNECKTI